MQGVNIRLATRKHGSHGVDALPDLLHTGKEDEHTATLVFGVGDDVADDLGN